MTSSNGSDLDEDLLQMVEEDDINFLKNAIDNRDYSILKKIKYVQQGSNAKRRKTEHYNDTEKLENAYENQLEKRENVKNLLPIKTEQGIVTRTILRPNAVDNNKSEENILENKKNEDNEDEYILDTEIDTSIPKSIADILIHYNDSLRNKKIHIGYLCTSLLENPEEKVSNFRTLFKILDDDVLEASLSSRKLIIISLLEVFKDILPSYQIKHQDIKNIKLKKDTLKLYKYEETLLQYYKKYLQKIEKFSNVLKKRVTKKLSEEEFKLGELAIHAMCDLLVTHPYFNFSQNIAQAVIPFLNHKEASIRQIVALTCKTVFKEDKKEEITLKILRVINQYLKNRVHNVKPDILEVLLHLKIKEINLDQKRENEMKQKKITSHKQNILKLSKKERKRKRRLQDLEKEMLETKAEESRHMKQRNLTEITKLVFSIYFRILKSSGNTKVLRVSLEGLAKFSHVINLDYWVDLLNLLNGLLNEERLDYREQLHCIQTVFTILHEQADSINLDSTRLYAHLYSNLLQIHSAKASENCSIILNILSDVLIRRKKIITSKKTVGFVKRIATLSLQLLHNGSLGCLALIKQILMLNKSVDILLDPESSIGDGEYQSELNDPEYCNASSTALYELTLLNKHYHPIVSKFVKYIVNGMPSSGKESLTIQFNKASPEQLFTDYNMTEMAFNPPVQIPKKVQPRLKRKKIHFADINFEHHCNVIVKNMNCNLSS